MKLVLLLYLFLAGTIFGSFVGAMAWRYTKGMKISNDRSECEHCHHKLGVKDLIPLLSWLYLRGKCRYCKKPIGWTPLLLELGLGLAFALSYVYWPFELANALDWSLFGLWLISLVGLAFLFIYDIRHGLLPDVVTYPLMVTGLAMFLIMHSDSIPSTMLLVRELIFGLLPITGLYGLLYKVSKGEWVGLGDVKLGVFIGLILGWQGALLALMLSNVLGLLWVAPGLVTKKLTTSAHVPFGPFLIVAVYIVFLLGGRLTDWYFNSLI